MMPSRTFVAVSCALWLCVSAPAARAAVAQSQPPVKEAASPEPQHPLLWKVSDADNSIYLLGSFHLLKQDDLPLPAEVDRAYDASSSLLFEVDPAVMAAPETKVLAQQYMGYADGRTLSSVISKDAAQRLATLMSASGGTILQVEGFEPWAVTMSLTLGMMRALGYRSELGVDQWLMTRAQKAGKPARGLETAEQGFSALDSVPYAEQIRDLDEFLHDPQSIASRLQEMHASWRAGDAAEMERLLQVEMVAKAPETYRLLLVQRNQAWLPQVERRLTDAHGEDTLVVVGAFHLLGPDGLVEQLRAKGYTVERVCDACAVADIH